MFRKGGYECDADSHTFNFAMHSPFKVVKESVSGK